jgi:transcriptional regulator GlxA family with amidase domain
MRIAIVIFDGVDELDVMGPLETLRRAAQLGAPFEVEAVTYDGLQSITGAYGATISADGPYRPGADIVIFPGGGWLAQAERGVRAEVRSGRWTLPIRQAAESGAVLASVCTGGMLLASTGLLAGRRATTHQGAWADLKDAGAEVVRDRVVDDGNLVTAGGVTSGIDLALWLVERFAGADMANRIATALEYRRQRPAAS